MVGCADPPAWGLGLGVQQSRAARRVASVTTRAKGPLRGDHRAGGLSQPEGQRRRQVMARAKADMGVERTPYGWRVRCAGGGGGSWTRQGLRRLRPGSVSRVQGARRRNQSKDEGAQEWLRVQLAFTF